MKGQDPRIPSGCAIAGFMSEKGRLFNGEDIIKSIALMHDRSNGLGGGFAAYGIYPELKDYYAFHMMFTSKTAKDEAEEYFRHHFEVIKDEPIPTRRIKEITDAPILWRYFMAVPKKLRQELDEEDYVVARVMEINSGMDGAFVASSGKNMGAFKAVGYPEDVGRFYRLEEYEAYCWTAHGRFPTNTPGWWGGAHPFGLLNWAVVHNGEISSYGINKRYLEMYGYKCMLMTDTEVITYAVDLLRRKHGLPMELMAKVLSAPFWNRIERLPEEEREMLTALRQVYGSALLNGPFSIIITNGREMVSLTDRVKLRPCIAARKDDVVYVASEESAILEICPSPDKVWVPRAGEPVVARLEVEV